MSLRDYARKRRFDATPEPATDQGRRGRGKRAPIFVVQLHHARARHYDFRLEADGVLKSWAVPRGPSLRPGDQRLAVEVEDHPVAYAEFAGDIPEGHYGAGHVDLFDRGTWTPEDDDPLKALARGKLDFALQGKHLRGRWTLVRTRRQGGKNQWLLLKRSDSEARDAEADDFLDPAMRKATAAWFAAHGKPMPAAAKAAPARKREGASKGKSRKASPQRAAARTARADAPSATERRRAPARSIGEKTPTTKAGVSRRKADRSWRTRALALAGARDRPLRAGFHAQLARQQAAPPAGDDWLHETKWDGYRLLADLDDGHVRLRSRNDLDWTERLPQIARAVEHLPVHQARLDGELVALDRHGHSDFAALQAALKDGVKATLRYVVFDLPGVAEVDLAATPLRERKALLEALLDGADTALAYSSHVDGHGAAVFEAAVKRGLEGIVSKHADSAYAGRRSGDWIKVKHALSDEFAIVGYTPPQGGRQGFGALLLATPEHGELRYVGRVGTGFDDRTLRALVARLKKLAVDDAVVEIPAHVPLPRRRIHWVRPVLVAEIAFRGWGGHRLLRQGSFLRLREDKGMNDLGDTSAPPARKAAKKKRATTGASAPRTAVSGGNAAPDIAITHASRVVFPGTRITKGDVAAYYTAVADWILPELAKRPLSLLRCPGGAGGECFFQKHHAATLGESVQAVTLKEKNAGSGEYVYIRDLAGLLELVQMNTLEFHPWGARVDKPDAPDRLVFDLDPAEGVAWKDVTAAAREIRARLADTGLESFVRTSGGKGLHVVVPFRRGPGWDAAKAFCEAFADAMVELHPLKYVATASKAQRKGRIFIDWLRNARGATSVCSWSLRTRDGAPVAVPLRWEELGRVKSGAAFDLPKALKRAKGLKADPWEGFATLRQRLPKL